METPAHDHLPTPAELALDMLVDNVEDPAALDTLAGSDVLVPVPDDAGDTDTVDPSMIALPVLERPEGDPVVPVFTTETAMTDLLPSVSRYRLVPLAALAAQWPEDELCLAIDGSSTHGLTLTSEGVRTLLAHRSG